MQLIKAQVTSIIALNAYNEYISSTNGCCVSGDSGFFEVTKDSLFKVKVQLQNCKFNNVTAVAASGL